MVVVATFGDSGYYFAFFNKRGGEEYLRIILGFGIMATYVVLSPRAIRLKREEQY